jgi:hypothetical protein
MDVYKSVCFYEEQASVHTYTYHIGVVHLKSRTGVVNYASTRVVKYLSTGEFVL